MVWFCRDLGQWSFFPSIVLCSNISPNFWRSQSYFLQVFFFLFIFFFYFYALMRSVGGGVITTSQETPPPPSSSPSHSATVSCRPTPRPLTQIVFLWLSRYGGGHDTAVDADLLSNSGTLWINSLRIVLFCFVFRSKGHDSFSASAC